MKKFFIFLVFLALIILSFDQASAQQKPQVTVTVISGSTHNMGPDSTDPDVGTNNELREPRAEDVVDAMKKKKQVTVVIWQNNGTKRWAHAVRVRAINVAVRNETDPSTNQTTYYYDARIYDPTSNATYNRSFAYVVYNSTTNSSLYLDWNGWSVVRDVVTVSSSPQKGKGLLYQKIEQFGFLPLLNSRKVLSRLY